MGPLQRCAPRGPISLGLISVGGPSLREGKPGSEAPYTQLFLTFLTLQLLFLCHPISLAIPCPIHTSCSVGICLHLLWVGPQAPVTGR